MQLLQAGSHQIVLLELDSGLLRQGAEEIGYQCTVSDTPRNVILQLRSTNQENPLLLFDASDPSNTGWFSRCQFYVDGLSGAVLQTPFAVATHADASGRLNNREITVQVRKELPSHFRLPGRQPANEKVLYSVLFNFLSALQKVGVGICAPTAVRPLAGRVDAPPSRG